MWRPGGEWAAADQANAAMMASKPDARLIRLADQCGCIRRVGKLGVAYFGNERRVCVGWGYVADFRAPADKAQRRWVELSLRWPFVRRAKWKPI